MQSLHALQNKPFKLILIRKKLLSNLLDTWHSTSDVILTKNVMLASKGNMNKWVPSTV